MVTNLFEALMLTIVIEGMVAYLMGYRRVECFYMILLVNIVTNPLVNYCLMLVTYFELNRIYDIIEIILEILVVLAEWRLLCYGLKESKKKMLQLSLAMNIASFLTGVTLQIII